MTVSTQTVVYQYSGAGTTGPFSFPQRFLADADLRVIKRTTATGAEQLLTLNTDYTVTGAGSGSGGSITTTAAVAATEQIHIEHRPQQTQGVDLAANESFPAETIEAGLDRLALALQSLQHQIGRCLKVVDTDTSVGTQLAALSANAGKLIKIAANGSGFTLIDDNTDIPTLVTNLIANASALETLTEAVVAQFDTLDGDEMAAAIAGNSAAVATLNTALTAALTAANAQAIVDAITGNPAVLLDLGGELLFQGNNVDAAGILTAIDATPALEDTLQGLVFDITKPIHIVDADNTGATDASTAIDNALSIPQFSGVIIIPPGTYLLSSTVTLTAGISANVIAEGAEFIINTAIDAFVFDGSLVETVTLTSVVQNDGFALVTHSALSTVLTKGRLIRLLSNAVDPAHLDRGSDALQHRVGEWVEVVGRLSATETLIIAPHFPRGVSAGSSGGDEARVNAYSAGQSARLVVPSEATLRWRGGTIRYADSVIGNSITPVTVLGRRRPIIEGLTVASSPGKGVAIEGCYGAVVRDCQFQDLPPNTGVAVLDNGAFTRMENCVVTGGEAAYATKDEPVGALASALPRQRLTQGRVEGAVIRDVTAAGLATGFITTHSAEDPLFQGCIARGCQTGALFHGRGVKMADSAIIACLEGVRAFTEVDQGQADDDLYTAGKPDGYTTVTLSNVDIEAVQDTGLFVERVRRFTVDNCRIRTAKYDAVRCDRSFVEFTGKCSVIVDDLDGRVTSVPASNFDGVLNSRRAFGDLPAADYPSEIRFAPGCEVLIDCTGHQSSGTLYGFNTLSPGAFRFDGHVTFRAPLNVLTLLGGSAATYSAGVDGLLEYDMSGAATLNLLGGTMRARRADGVQFINAAGSAEERAGPALIEAFNGANIAGTGAVIASAYVPAIPIPDILDNAGEWASIKARIDKTGATGSAQVLLKLDTITIATIDFLAADDTAFLDVEMHALAGNLKQCTVQWRAALATGAISDQRLLTVTPTVALASAAQMFRFDVDGAVGDSFRFRNVRVDTSAPAKAVNS